MMMQFSSFSRWFYLNKNRFDALVFDIDGVLFISGEPVEGAGAFLEKLRKDSIPFTLLTNDDTHSHQEKASALSCAGIDIFPHEITSCGDGLIDYVEKNGLKNALFYQMGHMGAPGYAEKAGLIITRNIDEIGKTKGILINETLGGWETNLNGIVNHLIKNPDAPLIVPNPDPAYPDRDGKLTIGPGAIAGLIQIVLSAKGIHKKTVFLGKPYEPIFRKNHNKLEKMAKKPIDRERVIMIGDFIEADIKGANRFGYCSALMLTGLTKPAELEKITGTDGLSADGIPNFVFQTL